MKKWKEVIAMPAFQDMNSTEQGLVRERWVNEVYIPKLKEVNIPEQDIKGLAYEAISNYDNGQGYGSSAIGAFVRGVGTVVPDIVQGAGEVFGSEGLVQTGKEMQQGLENFAGINPSMPRINTAGDLTGMSAVVALVMGLVFWRKVAKFSGGWRDWKWLSYCRTKGGGSGKRQARGPEGIGGWLAWFCFGLIVLIPFSALAIAAGEYKVVEADFNEALHGWYVFRMVAVALVSMGGIFFGVALWKRNPKGREWAKIYFRGRLAIMLLVNVILGLFAMEQDGRVARSLRDGAVIGVVGEIAFFVVWGSYFRRSRRVRNTFPHVDDPPLKADDAANNVNTNPAPLTPEQPNPNGLGPLWIDFIVASLAMGFAKELVGGALPVVGAGILAFFVSNVVRRQLKDDAKDRVTVQPRVQFYQGTIPGAPLPGVPVPAVTLAPTPVVSHSDRKEWLAGVEASLVGYEMLARELAAGSRHEALWLKVTSENGGDESLAKAAYNRERAVMLQTEHEAEFMRSAEEEEASRKRDEKLASERAAKQAAVKASITNYLDSNDAEIRFRSKKFLEEKKAILEKLREDSYFTDQPTCERLEHAQAKCQELLLLHGNHVATLAALEPALKEKRVHDVRKGLQLLEGGQFSDINYLPYENLVFYRYWLPRIAVTVLLLAAVIGLAVHFLNVQILAEREKSFGTAIASFQAKKYPEAFRKMIEAKRLGHPAAVAKLEEIYKAGTKDNPLKPEDFEWHREAADYGVPQAQFNMAEIYTEGIGVAKDLSKAWDLYDLAASQGHAEALYKLGALREGPDVPGVFHSILPLYRGNGSAFECYQKAAALGHTKAKIRLLELQAKEAGRKEEAKRASNTLSPVPAVPQGFTNSLGMKFVPVPGTDVLFCIHETRSRDFAAFIDDPNRDYPMSGSDADDWRTYEYKGVPVGHGVGEKAAESDHPVCNVSWLDAVAFCDWLSKKDGKTYRLPTDREWSVAVGIPHEPLGTPKDLDRKLPGIYPWGGSFTATTISGNYSDTAASAKFGKDWPLIENYRDGFATTAPVMEFRTNPLGLYDMGGNVWEWVAGCYDGQDPQGHDKSLTNIRALRGGSWYNDSPANLLSSNRNSNGPVYRIISIGFRVVAASGSGG